MTLHAVRDPMTPEQVDAWCERYGNTPLYRLALETSANGDPGPLHVMAALRAEVADLRAEVARHHADFERWEQMAASGAGKGEAAELLAAFVPGSPWSVEWGSQPCRMCGRAKPEHRDDCAWVRARTLLDLPVDVP